jgi:sulfopyruvate decarboxylase subunit alpha
VSTYETGSGQIIAGLERAGLRYLIHIPTAQSELIVRHFEQQPGARVMVVCREDEGVAALAGIALAGQVGAMIMQDNGLGVSLNALCTLQKEYHLPGLFLVPRGGGFGETRVGIQEFSEQIVDIMHAAQLKTFELDHRVALTDWADAIENAHRYSVHTRRPVVVFYNLMGWGHHP